MPLTPKYIASFESDAYYHIICKALKNQMLFLSDENKRYFLQRYGYYLQDYLNTYCYNLLDNHCHFLIRMKKEDEIRKALKLISDNKLTAVQKKFISDDISLDSLIERQFNSFFVSYTRSLNILYKKKGHLFDSPFKRILIENETHLSHLIVYIHANAVKHKLVKCIADYSWSSYSSIISDKPTKLSRQEVFHLFGGKDRFIETHLMQTEYYYKFEE